MILIMSVVCVVDDEIFFNVVLQISVVSLVIDEIIFNVVLKISVVSVWLSLKRKFGGCGHGFSGCDGLGRLGGLG